MQITNIKESGTNSTLLWAISNGANPKTDEALMSIVNDELFYLVTLSDINFLELFRLTQMYREKLRILNMKQITIPDMKELNEMFNGIYEVPDPDNPEEKAKAPLAQLVQMAITPFMNLVKQMSVDDDIIDPGNNILFVPMICRKFDVQIPVAFYDFVTSMTEDEANQIFNQEYPNSLQTIIDSPVHSVKTVLTMGFVKGTQILKYNPRYDQYIKLVKYAPLRTAKKEKLYSLGMLGFHKYDNISRGEVRLSLTPVPPSTDILAATLKRLASLTTPLLVDFAISLPLQYMQVLENLYSPVELPISYEASMATIINFGIDFNNFSTPVDTENLEDEEVKNVVNEINAYKVRIGEANMAILNALPVIIDNEGDVSVTGAFAMLPSIYNAKAVITVDISKSKQYLNCPDPILAEMFRDIFGVASSILADINKAK